MSMARKSGQAKWQFDGDILRQNAGLAGLIGVDEVGRGCLAGPVVTGAVWCERGFFQQSSAAEFVDYVKDSKQLSHEERVQAWRAYQEYLATGQRNVLFAWGLATVKEIERLNILGATRLAMQRAILRLQRAVTGLLPDNPFEAQMSLLSVGQEHASVRAGLLVDGRPLKPFPWQHYAFPKADDKSFCVGLASIGAKLLRDRHLTRLEQRWPGYGLGKHKGYATAEHRQAIIRLGVLPIHRSLFCRNIQEACEVE
jgi:ribonuclease HII